MTTATMTAPVPASRIAPEQTTRTSGRTESQHGPTLGSALYTGVRFLGNLAIACGSVLVLGTDAEH
jgi:hypothetical protein